MYRKRYRKDKQSIVRNVTVQKDNKYLRLYILYCKNIEESHTCPSCINNNELLHVI